MTAPRANRPLVVLHFAPHESAVIDQAIVTTGQTATAFARDAVLAIANGIVLGVCTVEQRGSHDDN